MKSKTEKGKIKTGMKGSLRTELVAINSIIMIVLLVVTIIVAITVSLANIGAVSNKVKESMTKTLEEKLKKSVAVTINILKEKQNSMLKDASIIGNNENVVSIAGYGYAKTNEFNSESFVASGDKYNVAYKQAGMFEFMRLASNLQLSAYNADAAIQLEIADSTGTIKSKTRNLNESFKEENSSEYVTEQITAPSSQITNIVAGSEGMAIKAYGSINKNSPEQDKRGVIILTLPFDNTFALELKRFTDNEIAIFNGDNYMYGTFYNTNYNEIKQEEIYKKFIELNPEGTVKEKNAKGEDIYVPEGIIKNEVLKFKKLDAEGKIIYENQSEQDKKDGKELVAVMVDKNYKIAYIPIRDIKGQKVGMIAVATETKDMDTAIAEFDKSKKAMVAGILITLILIALVGITIAMLLIYLYSGKIVKQIRKVLDVVERVAEGDLTHKVDIKGNNEVSELGKGINKMVNSLETIVCQITNTSETMASSTEEILATSESNKTAMEGIVTVSNNIQNKTTEELHKIKEAVDFISQINSGIKEISRYSERVTAKSHESSEIAKDGGEAVKNAIESITKIKTTVEDTAKIVDVLQEKTDVIEKVVTVITGIAEQTNLLALNAAIEAARAGEVGKGFAVVANEVKKLANQSAEAAEEIRKIVIGIKQEAKNVNASVDKGIEEVEKGAAISKKAREALEEIISSVYETTEMVTEITASTQEQAASTEESLKIMEELSKESENTNKISKEISNAAKDRLVGVQEIVIGVNTILESAESLSNMVDVFKISQCKTEEYDMKK
jgi:methyl-accepting chemotaxis protein